MVSPCPKALSLAFFVLTMPGVSHYIQSGQGKIKENERQWLIYEQQSFLHFAVIEDSTLFP